MEWCGPGVRRSVSCIINKNTLPLIPLLGFNDNHIQESRAVPQRPLRMDTFKSKTSQAPMKWEQQRCLNAAKVMNLKER